jgi:hypothetical protein
MLRHVVSYISDNDSEEPIASIQPKLNSSILKMETSGSPERLLNFYRTIRRHSPDENTGSHKLTTCLNDSRIVLLFALSSAYQETTYLLNSAGTLPVIFTKVCQCTQSSSSTIQFSPSNPIYIQFTLILLPYHCLNVPKCPLRFTDKHFVYTLHLMLQHKASVPFET